MPKEAPDTEATASAPETVPAKTNLASRFQAKMNPADAATAPEKKDPADAATAPEKKDPAAPDKKDVVTEPGKKDVSAPEESEFEAEIQRETASMPAKDRAAFTKLRYSERDARRQLRELTAQLEEAKKAPAAAVEPNADLEALRAQLAEKDSKLAKYEGEIKSVKIEATDEFQDRVVKPRDTVLNKAEALGDKYKVSIDTLERAFRTGSADDVATVTADFSEYDRYAFFGLVSKYQEVLQVEQGLRDNAATELERISRAARERQELEGRARDEEWNKAAPDVWAQIQEEFPVLSHIEGDADWNKEVDSVKEFATSGRFGSLTTREQVETLYRARAFPALIAEFDALRVEHDRVSEELKKYESVSADVKNSGRDTVPGGDESTSMADRFAKLARRKS